MNLQGVTQLDLLTIANIPIVYLMLYVVCASWKIVHLVVILALFLGWSTILDNFIFVSHLGTKCSICGMAFRSTYIVLFNAFGLVLTAT